MGGVLHQHSRPHGDPPSRPTKRHPGKAAAVSPQLQLLQRSLPPVPALPEPPLGTLLSRGPVVAELCGVVAVSPGTGMRHSPRRRGFPAQSERERRKGRLAAFLLASFHFPLLMLFSLFMAPCLSLEPQQTSLESSANRNKRGRVFSGSSKHPPPGASTSRLRLLEPCPPPADEAPEGRSTLALPFSEGARGEDKGQSLGGTRGCLSLHAHPSSPPSRLLQGKHFG